jgi:type IV pilus assembly protein PilQ
MKTHRTLATGQASALVCLTAALFLAAAAVAQEAATRPDLVPAAATADDANLKMTSPGVFKEMHFHGADLRLVLQMLSTQGKKNIVATREVTGTVTADLYDVTFKEALDAAVRSNGYVWEDRGNVIRVLTPAQAEALKKAERPMMTRTFRLAYISANDAKALIAPALSKEGTIATTPAAGIGISTSKTDAGGNSYSTEDLLVINDYEDNLARIGELVAQLDVKPEQVLIEATILRASLKEDNALGVDFNVLSGVNFAELNAETTGLGPLTYGKVSAASVGNGSAFRSDFASAVPSGGLNVGVISNDVAFFVRALEGVTDTTVLANPKLLVINKQRGEVIVGQRDGYLTTTITETVATQTVQFLETGTRLVVRPFIGRDGYIRLEIHPEDSSGGTQTVGQNVIPSETTTEVTSNVLVRDGRTIVIGGLFRERTEAKRSQIPIAGNLPYVGPLFRSTADSTQREEVIVLITPRIIKQDADEAIAAAVKDDVQRFRIGARKGLQWWGRERLAQAHMREVRHEMQEGDLCGAMWNLDLALSMQPRMIEAVRMKERLTDQAIWSGETEGSSVHFLIQRMMMQDLGKPYTRIIEPCRPAEVLQMEPDIREKFGYKPAAEDPPGACFRPNCDTVQFEPLLPPAAQPATTRPAVAPPATSQPVEIVVPPLVPVKSPATQPAVAAVQPADEPAVATPAPATAQLDEPAAQEADSEVVAAN